MIIRALHPEYLIAWSGFPSSRTLYLKQQNSNNNRLSKESNVGEGRLGCYAPHTSFQRGCFYRPSSGAALTRTHHLDDSIMEQYLVSISHLILLLYRQEQSLHTYQASGNGWRPFLLSQVNLTASPHIPSLFPHLRKPTPCTQETHSPLWTC